MLGSSKGLNIMLVFIESGERNRNGCIDWNVYTAICNTVRGNVEAPLLLSLFELSLVVSDFLLRLLSQFLRLFLSLRL